MLRSIVRTSVASHVCGVRAAAPVSAFALAAAAAPVPTSAVFLTATRGVVVDRAARIVSLNRRTRRSLLRNLAQRERPADTMARRVGSDPAPLASFDNSAANLNQFLAFLARQHRDRLAKGDAPAATSESTQIVRSAAAAGWQLTFDRLRDFMSMRQNRSSFRACEEIVGVLSDPTTDLGQRGLDAEEFGFVVAYVSDVMKATFREVHPRLEAAHGEFQALSSEDQYLLAGAHSIVYLLARVQQDTVAAEAALLSARAQNILPPKRTLLAQAMQHDVYPAHDPASLAASAAWPLIEADTNTTA